MSMFTLYFTNTSSSVVKVEAVDLDEAIDLAYDQLPSSICAQCSGWGSDWNRDESDWEFEEESYYVDGVEVRND